MLTCKGLIIKVTWLVYSQSLKISVCFAIYPRKASAESVVQGNNYYFIVTVIVKNYVMHRWIDLGTNIPWLPNTKTDAYPKHVGFLLRCRVWIYSIHSKTTVSTIVCCYFMGLKQFCNTVTISLFTTISMRNSQIPSNVNIARILSPVPDFLNWEYR